MKIERLTDILETAKSSGFRWRLSVAGANDPHTLTAISNACDNGFATGLLFGPRAGIESAAKKAGVTLDDRFVIVQTDSDEQSVQCSCEFVYSGKADVLVKGLVPTGTILRAVLQHEMGPQDRLLSHVGIFHHPVTGRMMLMTDAAINISPNVQRKVEIVRNAVWVAKALGIERPRVAMLAAVEKLNYPSMPSTVDAVLVSRVASVEIPEAHVEGPYALDNAVSAESAVRKNLQGEVPGRADILVAHDIESANVLYKALQSFCGTTFAGVVAGASKPVALTSRADSEDTKLITIALACILSGKPCTQSL